MKKTLMNTLTVISLMTIATGADGASANPLISGSNAQYGTLPFSKITPPTMKRE